jgi:hypothetical protein
MLSKKALNFLVIIALTTATFLWTFFIFHIAFLIIIFGATVTRYIGFEGSMHIREGSSSSSLVSSDTYFTVNVKLDKEEISSSDAIYLSKRLNNTLSSSMSIGSKDINIELIEYIPNAIESYVEDKELGKPVINLMVTSSGSGESVLLRDGEFKDNGDYILDFNSKKEFKKDVISLYIENEKLYMKHPKELKYLKMDDKSEGILSANDREPLVNRTLFTMGDSSFVLRKFAPYAITKLVSNPNIPLRNDGNNALRFKIDVDDVSKEVTIFGRAGVLAKKNHYRVNGVDIELFYGAKRIKLPFEIELKDFQLERYPGSMSPSSYASEVVLQDNKNGVNMPFRIYMNHILEYDGYRFFQSSYDQDERGTILSVNNDPGTLPSYIGYFLLAVGMFWSLFSKSNRFSKLSQKAKKASGSLAVFIFSILLLATNSELEATELNPTLKTIISFDRVHANKFGELIVQDSGGRMKPLDTLSTEILAKINRSSAIEILNYNLNANQVILGMMVRPDAYKDIKIIYTKDENINRLIGAKLDSKYASFSQFFEDSNNMRGYKLAQAVDEAIRKAPKDRNKNR